jgi:hypothetical protein
VESGDVGQRKGHVHGALVGKLGQTHREVVDPVHAKVTAGEKKKCAMLAAISHPSVYSSKLRKRPAICIKIIPSVYTIRLRKRLTACIKNPHT